MDISIAKPTLSWELRAMSYRMLSARPRHHAQVDGAIEDIKNYPAGLDTIANRITRVAATLLNRRHLNDTEVRAFAGLPEPPDVYY